MFSMHLPQEKPTSEANSGSASKSSKEIFLQMHIIIIRMRFCLGLLGIPAG